MINLIDISLYEKGKAVDMIGDLIPTGETTLLYGESGCGKTTSVLKYLTKHDVVPVFLDFFDINDGIGDIVGEMVHVDGFKFWDNFVELYSPSTKDELVKQLSNKVFVIDTYAMANNYISVTTENSQNIQSLCSFLTGANSTVVVIAHSRTDGKPDVDTVWANHLGCKLHLRKDILKTKTNVYLEVEKLRGYKGKDIVPDWMRS